MEKNIIKFHGFRNALRKFIKEQYSEGGSACWYISSINKVNLLHGFKVFYGNNEVADIRHEKMCRLVIYRGKDLDAFCDNREEEDILFFKNLCPAIKEEMSKYGVNILDFAEYMSRT